MTILHYVVLTVTAAISMFCSSVAITTLMLASWAPDPRLRLLSGSLLAASALNIALLVLYLSNP